MAGVLMIDYILPSDSAFCFIRAQILCAGHGRNAQCERKDHAEMRFHHLGSPLRGEAGERIVISVEERCQRTTLILSVFCKLFALVG